MNLILEETKERMEKSVASFEGSLDSVRSGRANANLLNGIEVDYYGSPMPINQLASLTVQEGRTIVIKPFDMGSLKYIEKAINKSDLGLPPQNDCKVIRVTVPALTEETRRNLCKDVSKMAENAKVSVRNIRRDANDQAKKEESLTEDQEKQCLEKIQKLTDEMIKKIDHVYKFFNQAFEKKLTKYLKNVNQAFGNC